MKLVTVEQFNFMEITACKERALHDSVRTKTKNGLFSKSLERLVFIRRGQLW